MTMPVSEEGLYRTLPPLQSSILAILRACGGRLLVTDLVFELRRRGICIESVTSAMRALCLGGLVRGPLLRTPMYELTVAGWDIGRPQ